MLEALAGTERTAEAEWFAFGPYILFPAERVLKRDGRQLQIGDKSLDLLLALLEAPGEILTKSELAERVWRRSIIEDGSLRVAIGALRKLLGPTPDDGEYIVNVVGRGYSFSPAVPYEQWPDRGVGNKAIARRGIVKSQGRLPPLLNPVFGRRADVKIINDLLATRRFVTIAGAGGIGKTTLAISCASLRTNTGTEVCFVDLAPVRDPALVLPRVASGLGLEPKAADLLKLIVEHLSSEATLIVIDNAEHVIEAVATAIEGILAGAIEASALVTSREPLGAEGEIVFRLSPLGLPDETYALTAVEALKYGAIALFVDRVQANDPEFILTDALAPIVADICRKLDGVPLALRLAAGRVSAFGVRGVADHLGHKFQHFSQTQRGVVQRHQTLKAAFDWSYDLLLLPEQDLLSRVAIFAQGFSLAAILEVAGENGALESDLFATIGDLVAKSLVVFVDDEDGPRYRLLETVRAFAAARLEMAGEYSETARRHAQFVIGRCDRYQSELTRGRDTQAASISRETLDDARSALRWTIGNSDWPLATDLIRAAGPLLTQMGFSREVGDWIERLLEVETDPQKRLPLLISLGGALWLSTPEDITTVKVYAEAYELARELDDVDAQLRAAWSLILTTCSARRPKESIFAAQLLTTSRWASTAGENIKNAELIAALAGVSQHLLGDYAECERNIRWLLANYPAEKRAIESSAYLYDPRQIGRPFLAWIEWFSGRLSDAVATSECVIVDSGDHVPSIVNNILRSAFPIAADSGKWDIAEGYVKTLRRHCSDRPGWRAWINALQDIISMRTQGSRDALQRLDEFVTGGEGFTGFKRQTWYVLQLIKGLMAYGDLRRADQLLRKVLDFVETEEDNWWRPEMVALEANLLARSDRQSGYARYRRAADLARAEGSALIELRAAMCACRIATSPEDREDARRLANDAHNRLVKRVAPELAAENRSLVRSVLLACGRLQRSVLAVSDQDLGATGAMN